MKNIFIFEEAVRFIEEQGFLFLSKNKYDNLSLENVTNEKMWYSGTKDDPWVWKDRIAQEKRAAYAKLFGKKQMFVTWDWYPTLLSYLRNGMTMDEFYDNGLLSSCGKEIYQLLSEQKELATHEIKQYLKLEKEKTKFENALTELQTKMLITISGSTQKKSKNGEPYGWRVSTFSLVDEWVDEEILAKANSIPFQKAKEDIYMQIRKRNEKITHKQIEKLIGVKLDWK